MTRVMESLDCEMTSDLRMKEIALANSRIRSRDDGSVEYNSGHDGAGMSSVAFELQKSERAPHRVPFASSTKPVPSKWVDAEKWIASPQSNRSKMGQSQEHGGQAFASRKTGVIGCGNWESATKVVVEVPDQKMVAVEEVDTKRIDPRQGKQEFGGKKFVNWAPDPYPVADSFAKPTLIIENPVANSSVTLSRHDSSVTVLSATTFMPPPSTIRSVSLRDMGTEMTPIASQEPSRTGTPTSATPIHSPFSSRPSTPRRTVPTSSNCQADPHNKLSEQELKMKTRREIMVLGTQLGKMNIAAWASKEKEDKDASTSLKTIVVDQPPKSVIETRAVAWEEAEKAKYMARYKREEIKTQAWENHQKAKTEAEMRKIEVEVERMRGRVHDKLMNKLAAARHKAEEKRAAAEAKRNKQAVRTEQQAEYIRRTGRIPTSISCWNCCS